MRRLLFFAACTAAVAAVVSPATAAPQRLAPTQSYVVLYENGTSLASARLAVRAAGGFLVAENRRVGVATATSSSPTFAADLLRQGAVARRRAEQARRLQRPRHAPAAVGRGSEPRRAGQRQEVKPGQNAHTGRRPARRAAVGHGDDPRHARGLVQGRAGRPSACSSACSTRASTAPIRTSRRTSTRR